MDKKDYMDSSDESNKGYHSNMNNENLNHSNSKNDKGEEIISLSEKNETLSQEICRKELEINEFNGRESIQINLKDIRKSC